MYLLFYPEPYEIVICEWYRSKFKTIRSKWWTLFYFKIKIKIQKTNKVIFMIFQKKFDIQVKEKYFFNKYMVKKSSSKISYITSSILIFVCK